MVAFAECHLKILLVRSSHGVSSEDRCW